MSLSSIKMGVEEIEVDAAQGRILAEDAIARVNVPPSISSAMDGYAMRSIETTHASPGMPIHFRILGSIFDNVNAQKLRITGRETYYVTTGAPVPEGADAVAKIEDTRINDNEVIIARPVPKGKNIVPIGQDIEDHQILVSKWRVLNGLDVALLIAAGVSRVNVIKVPRVGILSIGDTLRQFKDNTSDLERSSQPVVVNSFFNMIASFLSEIGISSSLLGVCKNNIGDIRRSIESHICNYDVILAIGGSSVGARDYTPSALSSADSSKIIFHGVKMVPIKPAGLVLVKNKPIIIVPAHASSAAFTFFMIVLPVLNIISGLQFDDRSVKLSAVCDEEIENPRALGALALVQLKRREDGLYHASHLGWYSNLISTVAKANGFVLMKARQIIHESELVSVEVLGPSQLGRIH